MSDYKHRITLVVPEQFIPQANQLALIAGESLDDINTFTSADYQDMHGHKYAVCSAVVKPIVLNLFGTDIVNSALSSANADVPAAQKALDISIIYEVNMMAGSERIVIGVDIEPLLFLESMGLSLTENNLGFQDL